MEIKSSAFRQGEFIPQKYTYDGQDVNPPLGIYDVPKNAKSLALISDDPDAPAGTWVHWLAWNINPGIERIDEDSVPEGAVQSINDFGKHSYSGPCPPYGTHRYFFRLYALDTNLNLSPSASRSDLDRAMEGHIIEHSELMGKYKRR